MWVSSTHSLHHMPHWQRSMMPFQYIYLLLDLDPSVILVWKKTRHRLNFFLLFRLPLLSYSLSKDSTFQKHTFWIVWFLGFKGKVINKMIKTFFKNDVLKAPLLIICGKRRKNMSLPAVKHRRIVCDETSSTDLTQNHAAKWLDVDFTNQGIKD